MQEVTWRWAGTLALYCIHRRSSGEKQSSGDSFRFSSTRMPEWRAELPSSASLPSVLEHLPVCGTGLNILRPNFAKHCDAVGLPGDLHTHFSKYETLLNYKIMLMHIMTAFT